VLDHSRYKAFFVLVMTEEPPRHCSSNRQLVVRESWELNSVLLSKKIEPGTALVVLKTKDLPDGTTQRGQMALQSAPNTVVGWVTLTKDGTSSVVYENATAIPKQSPSSTPAVRDASASANLGASMIHAATEVQTGSSGESLSDTPTATPNHSFSRGKSVTPSASMPEWVAASKRSVLLEKLAGAELKFVLQACKVIEKREGELLYDVGDHPDHFYVVQSGVSAAYMLACLVP